MRGPCGPPHSSSSDEKRDPALSPTARERAERSSDVCSAHRPFVVSGREPVRGIRCQREPLSGRGLDRDDDADGEAPVAAAVGIERSASASRRPSTVGRPRRRPDGLTRTSLQRNSLFRVGAEKLVYPFGTRCDCRALPQDDGKPRFAGLSEKKAL
jgi:hypothetical protein